MSKNNIAAASVLVVLILSTSRSLSLNDNENSLKSGGSQFDSLTLDPGSSSRGGIHECLFIDPDLPVCDVKRMLNAERDPPTSKGDPFKDHVFRRLARSLDLPVKNVVVYTIEGCLPPRLPFSMPSCDGISLDRIVDVQKFRPFVMKGVKKPPLVFPEFNYPQWQRMMNRLRNHASSRHKEAEEERRIVPQEVSLDDPIQGRTERLRNAATMKERIPNAMAANRNMSNGSSANRLILDNTLRSGGSLRSRSTDGLRLNGHGERSEGIEDRRSTIDGAEKSFDAGNDEWMNSGKKWMDRAYGPYGDYRHSRRGSHRIGYYLLPLKSGDYLGFDRRPARSSVTREEIVAIDESAWNGASFNTKERDANALGRRGKKSKGLKFDGRQTDADKNGSTSGIKRSVTFGSRVPAVNKDSPGKIDAFVGSKAVWRKSAAKETPLGKMYRNHGGLPSSRGH